MNARKLFREPDNPFPALISVTTIGRIQKCRQGSGGDVFNGWPPFDFELQKRATPGDGDIPGRNHASDVEPFGRIRSGIPSRLLEIKLKGPGAMPGPT